MRAQLCRGPLGAERSEHPGPSLHYNPLGAPKILCGELDHPACIKLIDFGFAQLSAADTPIDDSMVAGTLEYMSPEQILSDPIDARADIYSFGIVLFRWLTAELPFDSGPMLRLFAHHLESRPPPPSWLLEEIHPGLEKLILAAMRKDPANRYASMLEVLADLECVITGIGEVYGAPMQQERDEYWPRTEQAKRACRILGRVGVSTRPPPPMAPTAMAEVPVEEPADASDLSSVPFASDAISVALVSDAISAPLASDTISNAVSTPVSAPVQSQVRSSEKPGVRASRRLRKSDCG